MGSKSEESQCKSVQISANGEQKRRKSGEKLNSPVAEGLTKGLLAVWSPNKVVSAQNWWEKLNFPVAEWLNKGLMAVWSPNK
eukprot:700227-Prorocentrum_minimum.AAC.1